ncbi:MAG: hypothetical protein OXU45_07000 [Candidatus Melainabacteria bacterium]|nr:hypothetical protein [Candidatus Melainabacteria bacterium]
MSISRSEIFKLAALALVITLLQTSLLSSFEALAINLPVVAIFISSALLPAASNLIFATSLAIIVSLMTYGDTIFWTYPLLALIASKINPEQVRSKFLVAIVFSIMFTPVFEFIYAGNMANITTASITNLVSSIILFWSLKPFFKQ